MPTTTTAAAAHNTDRKAVMRDKRAQGIAAMGLVNREGDRFRVTTPSLRGRRSTYEVWRDDAGKVRCSCLEFEEAAARGGDAATTTITFRCEHILAVKHALVQKNSEPVTKQGELQQTPAAGAAEASPPAETPNTTDETAAEKQAGRQSEPARFGRETQESEGTATIEPVAFPAPTLALAEDTDIEEQFEMNGQHAFNAPEAPEQDLDFVTAEEHAALHNGGGSGAPVVPLAFTNTLRQLRQPIDPKLVKTREGWRDRNGQTHMVEYVEWHTVADLLDRVAPAWSHSVRGIVQIGDMVAVTAAITINGVTREGVGTGTADNETGIKKAEHDALKRAAIKFGIARELYQRESEVIEQTGSVPQSEFPRDPLAKSMSDLVTPKQLGMIRALAREAGVDVEEECQAVLRCRTEELSKKAASSFIDHLKNSQQQQQGEQQHPMRRAS
ncbi:MAG: Rad52/Rad22 family DNA repair protein [Pyrinomonadaceae bacterium]